MTMTTQEIAKSYREAKDRRVQIGILADLNVCKHNEIVQVLMDAGELTAEEYEKLIRKKPGPRPKSAPPEAPREGYTRLVLKPPAPPEPEAPSGACKNCSNHSPALPKDGREEALAFADALEAVAVQVKRLRDERADRLAEAQAIEARLQDMLRMLTQMFNEED